MKTSPLETDLSSYTVTFSPDPWLPKDIPQEQLELMLHHAKVEVQDRAYGKIEEDTGLTREHLTHVWTEAQGKSVCTFTQISEPAAWSLKPGNVHRAPLGFHFLALVQLRMNARNNWCRSLVRLRHNFALILVALGFYGFVPAVADTLSQKHVLIDKSRQELYAYEGDRVAFQCRVSTGRGTGWTPNGDFTAGDKSVIHYSSLFHQAPMPYSVHVVGDIFIHGFGDVPAWPASHGCIRVPLDGDNPARKFFNWVESGTPIRITGEWKGLEKTRPPIFIGPLN